jgi:hypothetical protein
VRHVPPRDDRASAPAGFDWISSSVGGGLGLNASKLGMVEDDPQAASPKAQITVIKAQSNFMSAIRVAELRLDGRHHPRRNSGAGKHTNHEDSRAHRDACWPQHGQQFGPPQANRTGSFLHDTSPTRECLFRNRRFPAFWGRTVTALLRFRDCVARLQRACRAGASGRWRGQRLKACGSVTSPSRSRSVGFGL